VQEAKSTLNQEFELTENILVPNKSVSIHTNKLKDAKSANYFDYDKDISKRLLESPKSAIALQIPYEHEEGSHLTLDLIKVPDSFYDYIVTTSSGDKLNGRDIGGVHYRGIVGNETLCMTSSDGEQNPILEDLYLDVLNGSSDNSSDNCLRMYFEVDHDMYIHFSNSTPNTVNFVTGMFNQVAVIYMNESITMEISEIFVWDTPDSYPTGVVAARDQFVALRPTFNGDLAHLLTFRTGNFDPNNTSNAGGVANNFGGVCVTGNPDLSPHSHTSLFPDFETFPVFSRQVKVVTHEIGHNLGSRHTHACVWNGNNTAIDGCSGNTEGSCPLPGAIPANTGTIMSYCDRNLGIDFTLGFGPQPGNVIRNFVSSLTCLATCTNCPDNLDITDTYNNGDNEYLETPVLLPITVLSFWHILMVVIIMKMVIQESLPKTVKLMNQTSVSLSKTTPIPSPEPLP